MATKFFSNRFSRVRPHTIGEYHHKRIAPYKKVLSYFLLATFCWFYGFFFALTSEVLFAALLVPQGILLAIVLWAMPELRYPPVKALAFLFVAFIYAFLIWPNYIALAVSPLPWITAIRLTGLPLLFVLLLCVFGSRAFRVQMADILQGDAITWKLVAGFASLCLISIAYSTNIPFSTSKFLVAAWSWISIFFVSCFYFNKEGRVKSFAHILLFCTIYILAIGLYEVIYSALPWTGRIPAIFQIEDPSVAAILAGGGRAVSDEYRIQSKFATSLALGEYLAISIPFILYLIAYSKNKYIRLISIVVIPITLFVVIRSDSRLAQNCFILSCMLFVFLYFARKWYKNKLSIFAPAVLISFPVTGLSILILSFFWRRMEAIIWGDSTTQFSTQARHDQWAMGWPKIFARPWGYGFSNGGPTLDYYAPGSGMLTIDSYYLSTLLELGFLGFVVFYGIFVWAGGKAALAAITTDDDKETVFLGAASIVMANVLLAKSVFSGMDNNPLIFIIPGLIVALLRRYKFETGKLPPPPKEETLYRPKYQSAPNLQNNGLPKSPV